MTNMARSDVIIAGPTPEFIDLCQVLYGDDIDPDAVWDEVAKAGPDQADLNAHRAAARRTRIERGSNALGLTAGLMATGTALRDPRLAGHKSTKRLHELATHKRVPHLPKKWQKGKTGAALAVGALGTQLANTGGDLMIGGSYNDRANAKLKPTGRQRGNKAAADLGVPALNKTVAGARSAISSITSRLLPTGGKLPGSAAAGKPVLPQTVPGPSTAKPGRTERGAHAVGNAVNNAVGTSSGRKSMAVGGTAVLGVQQGNKAFKNRGGGGGGYSPVSMSLDGDVEWYGEFSKFEDDKQLAFGWASVSKFNGSPVVDKQGDYIDPGDLEDAAYDYVINSRVGGAMHARDGDSPLKVADIVESVVFTDDKVEAMGLPDNFPRGWWVGMKIHDPDEWELVKKGANGGRTGFSIHGRGIRKDQDEDELMYGYR